ncbi:hypothetical protein CLOBOL_03237 [Enterocloster bolteae ATCC BAA-613]|uniref:Uncharacterized protein n=1 Tax=Enterocloster bolteae (strain ATCC BAA-613 / DSM 15670 / CCUG 46953 / JCM 12243 / WAL 16351) TaxID=411902 RepID=A8RS89_ENTBW|nr:hypothetical protein CLOBOL_03237 [Enterocloster bolteae ATCC BAA-613]
MTVGNMYQIYSIRNLRPGKAPVFKKSAPARHWRRS